MKFNSISDVDAFVSAVDKCKGDVWLESAQGDRFNLKSELSRYVAIGELIKDESESLELFVREVDGKRIVSKSLAGSARRMPDRHQPRQHCRRRRPLDRHRRMGRVSVIPATNPLRPHGGLRTCGGRFRFRAPRIRRRPPGRDGHFSVFPQCQARRGARCGPGILHQRGEDLCRRLPVG